MTITEPAALTAAMARPPEGWVPAARHRNACVAAHPSARRWPLAGGAPAWAREAAACVAADDFAGARWVLAGARAVGEHRGSARDGAALE
ncbi:MAG TPA: hypothetical protein VMU14_18880, partial [Acidimicrobiales bacterium]|nr:hypothetical protein [Acidimicrobiales bacterium]